jgi:1,4-dihydroxy-2-naphthoyl-CoA hydrolase
MTLSEELHASYDPRVAEALAGATRAAPFPALLGFEIVEQRPGRVVCKLVVADRHKSGIGLVHGGVLTALIDHVLSIVVYPHVEVGKWAATVDLKVSYLAPVRDGEVIAEAEIVSLRKRIGAVRIDVRNARGSQGEPELVAAALGTVYIKDRPGRAPNE